MTKDEALKLALEYVELVQDDRYNAEHIDREALVTVIKEALAQPEQEPIGKFANFTDGIWREVTDGSAGVPLYTTPPQRTWVGLTDEEILKFQDIVPNTLGYDLIEFARTIEAKLKEKNT